MYTDYEIAFDEVGSWNFVNFVRSIVIIGANNSSSSHADNRTNNFFSIRLRTN